MTNKTNIKSKGTGRSKTTAWLKKQWA
jgi:hypothetical protein